MIDKYTAPEVQEALNLVVPCTWIIAPCTVIQITNKINSNSNVPR